MSKAERTETGYSFALAEAEKELKLEKNQILDLLCDLSLRGIVRIREMPYVSDIQLKLASVLEQAEIRCVLGRLFRAELLDIQMTTAAIMQSTGYASDLIVFSPRKFVEALDKIKRSTQQLMKLHSLSKQPTAAKMRKASTALDRVKVDLSEGLEESIRRSGILYDRFSQLHSKKVLELRELEDKEAELEIRHEIGEYTDEQQSQMKHDLDLEKEALARDAEYLIGLLADAFVLDRSNGENLDEEFDILRTRYSIGEIGIDAFEAQKKQLTDQLWATTRCHLDSEKLLGFRRDLKQLEESTSILAKDGLVEKDLSEGLNIVLNGCLALMENKPNVNR